MALRSGSGGDPCRREGTWESGQCRIQGLVRGDSDTCAYERLLSASWAILLGFEKWLNSKTVCFEALIFPSPISLLSLVDALKVDPDFAPIDGLERA